MSERRANLRSKRPIVFVADNARVVRTSELKRLYEIAGDQRTVAEALGVSASTVSRALDGSRLERPARRDRLAAVQEALGDA